MGFLRGPVKGTLILLVIAGALIAGLFAIQGRFAPRESAKDKIAFISDRGTHPDVWLMNADGSSAKPLTRDVRQDGDLSWSHDATKIVFASERGGEAQVFRLWAMKDEQARQLTVGSGVKLQPVFSPDGSRIAYISQGTVYVMSSEGEDIEPVLPVEVSDMASESSAGFEKSPYAQIDWSADGESLAAVQQLDDVQVPQLLTSIGGELNPIADTDGNIIAGERVSVKWAPKGRVVAVSSVSKNNGVLVVRDYDSDILTILISDLLPGRAAWAPSGEMIAFEVMGYKPGHGYSSTGLGIANVDSGEHSVIIRGDVERPSWTADGKRIIFTKAEKDGSRDIWSVSPDGKEAKNLTPGPGDDYDAVASPVGAE
ncbi:MAG: hypothetical protein Q7N50_11985 [Armatimonadota bacterium]|nr:hypothetical protein [Armatimonadota bacterium]